MAPELFARLSSLKLSKRTGPWRLGDQSNLLQARKAKWRVPSPSRIQKLVDIQSFQSVSQSLMGRLACRFIAPQSDSAEQAFFVRNDADVLGQLEVDVPRVPAAQVEVVPVEELRSLLDRLLD